MRATITIDDELLEAAEQRAVEQGGTLTDFVRDAIRAALSREPAGEQRRRFKLVTFRGDGPQPGVDLDRTSALLETDDAAAFGAKGST